MSLESDKAYIESFKAKPGTVIPDLTKYMSGQEWFNRFVKECLALPKDHGFVDMYEAAKRAAGLNDEGEI